MLKIKKFIKYDLFVPFVHIRRITFIPFVLSWFIKLPSFCVAAYPVVMVISFIYIHLTNHTPLIEWMLMWDIGEPIVYYYGQHRGGRLWNIWHYRNYKERKSLGNKIKILLLRIAVYAFIVFFILTILRFFFPEYYNLIARIIHLLPSPR